MTMRLAINGFGRIGRGALRALLSQSTDLTVVAMNDLAGPESLKQLYNFDSIYGRSQTPAEVVDHTMVVGDQRIELFAERDPAELPWADLGVDVVLESTGRFTAAADASAHLTAGARRVLVSAPSAGADVTLVKGVNWDAFDPTAHRIISQGSCTTGALAPLAHVLHQLAGITQGFMTTVHAFTGDQNLVDSPHSDPRRARAAASNIIPTSTGAASAIGKVLPELDGRLSGDSIRVPVAVGSLVELTAVVARQVTADEIRAAYRSASAGGLAGILEYSDDPLVSTDIVGRTASSIFDAGLVRVGDGMVKVVAWYDNECGFSHRAADTLRMLAAA